MATRFYFPADEASAAITPAVDSGWEHTQTTIVRRLAAAAGASLFVSG